MVKTKIQAMTVMMISALEGQVRADPIRVDGHPTDIDLCHCGRPSEVIVDRLFRRSTRDTGRVLVIPDVIPRYLYYAILTLVFGLLLVPDGLGVDDAEGLHRQRGVDRPSELQDASENPVDTERLVGEDYYVADYLLVVDQDRQQQVETKAEKKAADRQRKMDNMTKKANEAKTKTMSRMSLFDSTQMSSWEVIGTHAPGAMKATNGSIIIPGWNISAEPKEPNWDPDQKAIAIAKTTELVVDLVNNIRVSVMDEAIEYVGHDESGTLMPTEKTYASDLSPIEYVIGIGPDKLDVTGSPTFYADVVIAEVNETWLSNQWTSEGIVIDDVAANVLMQQNRAGNTSGRRTGQQFTRIGLSAYAFGPLFYTPESKFEGCLTQARSARDIPDMVKVSTDSTDTTMNEMRNMTMAATYDFIHNLGDMGFGDKSDAATRGLMTASDVTSVLPKQVPRDDPHRPGLKLGHGRDGKGQEQQVQDRIQGHQRQQEDG
ncbi:hypothetical protein FZEAL_2668 [Fusarium zealandicum]|uniref:Uncharacterized protein n=1 Tax=Fusarium zealandicum TaxID=1053134 RepID=A0A8H4XMJ7_9HYPO|nr:hypothetical protein FZEAL_2668 [Fusarium zealandicum]